ncbi:MAG: hypothetical protein JXB03_08410 [Spirochaetales bacterium]|nr:hypothetical protein [Spirochaetales bacterium]
MCYFCTKPLPAAVYRNSLCPDCGREIKTCHNCEYFAPGYQYDCRESIDELVVDKDRANFCDHFRPKKGGFAPNGETAKADGAKDRFKSLFGD